MSLFCYMAIDGDRTSIKMIATQLQEAGVSLEPGGQAERLGWSKLYGFAPQHPDAQEFNFIDNEKYDLVDLFQCTPEIPSPLIVTLEPLLSKLSNNTLICLCWDPDFTLRRDPTIIHGLDAFAKHVEGVRPNVEYAAPFRVHVRGEKSG